MSLGGTVKRISCDVLVIGGGAAGLMAAYEASKAATQVIVVNKGKVQRTGATIMAPGAIAAVDQRWAKPQDSQSLHAEDTIKGGMYLNDQELVHKLSEWAPKLVLELERMGSIFQREADNKTYSLRIDGGHSYPRCPYLEDRTGKEMMKGLAGALRKQRIPFHENIMIQRILVEDNQIIGAIGLQLETLELILYETSSIVLATGGAGMLYANTDNPIDLTGDGYALALAAGAKLRDMEFIQFYPLGFLFPPSLQGMLAGLLFHARLYNAKGERFMQHYDPERLELSTRDLVSRAIMQEVRSGRGSERGGVYMNFRHYDPGFIAQATPALYKTYQAMGIDPEHDQIEVAPTVHFFMGGIEVNAQWESSVSGLYAAGEATAGMHGGNRLSQNALAELLVSGYFAGKNAASSAKPMENVIIDHPAIEQEQCRIEAILQQSEGKTVHQISSRMKAIMWEKVGVFRSESSLTSALKEIQELKRTPVQLEHKDRWLNGNIKAALELENMLTVAEVVILSALERKESRAAHYREDYPELNNQDYLVNMIVSLEEGELQLEQKPVDLKYYESEATNES